MHQVGNIAQMYYCKELEFLPPTTGTCPCFTCQLRKSNEKFNRIMIILANPNYPSISVTTFSITIECVTLHKGAHHNTMKLSFVMQCEVFC
jgi:hypothetical protein